jgi:hypothetical protein
MLNYSLVCPSLLLKFFCSLDHVQILGNQRERVMSKGASRLLVTALEHVIRFVCLRTL